MTRIMKRNWWYSFKRTKNNRRLLSFFFWQAIFVIHSKVVCVKMVHHNLTSVLEISKYHYLVVRMYHLLCWLLVDFLRFFVFHLNMWFDSFVFFSTSIDDQSTSPMPTFTCKKLMIPFASIHFTPHVINGNVPFKTKATIFCHGKEGKRMTITCEKNGWSEKISSSICCK